MNKTRDGLLLSSAQSAPLTIEEKWSINMGEAGEKTDCPVSVVLLSVPVWYPAGSGGGGGGCFLFTIRSSVLVTTSVLFVLFVFVVFFDKVINAISGFFENFFLDNYFSKPGKKTDIDRTGLDWTYIRRTPLFGIFFFYGPIFLVHNFSKDGK